MSRALGRLLLKVESLEGQTRSDLAAVKGELASKLRPPPLDDLFALADTLGDLLEGLAGSDLLVLSPGELWALTLGDLAACLGGRGSSAREGGESAGLDRRARDFRRALCLSLERLDRFLAALGIERVGRVGEPVDGRALRVVEVVEREDLPDSSVASVVRSGFVRGKEVLREGDVVASRRPASGRRLAAPILEAAISRAASEDGSPAPGPGEGRELPVDSTGGRDGSGMGD